MYQLDLHVGYNDDEAVTDPTAEGTIVALLKGLLTHQGRTIVTITGTKSNGLDNVLIAAPGAGSRIVVVGYELQNESTTATTMILKDGSTAKRRVLGQNRGDGISRAFPVGRGWKLAENAALNLNLSGANSCGYTIDYYTEAV